jgi:hypothetical protein
MDMMGLLDLIGLQQLERSTGAKGHIHNKCSLGYYLHGGQESCPTFNGTAAQLLAALNIITTLAGQGPGFSSPTRCALRIAAPSEHSLTKVLATLPFLLENPLTLGVYIETNAYFAVKSIST